MSGMIVHGVPGSPYVRAALLTLEEKGAPYKLAAMAPGTLKQEPHLSMFSLAPEGSQILREHENLNAWLARIEARPSMQATTWDRLLERVVAAA